MLWGLQYTHKITREGWCAIGGKSSAPAAPDPTATSQAQTASNIQTAGYNKALNSNDVYSPLGNSTWTVTGKDPTTGAPIYANNITLNPYAQTALTETQQNQALTGSLGGQLLNGIGSQYTSPMSTSNLPGIRSSLDPATMGDSAVQNAENTSYNSQMSLLQPQMDQQSKALEDQLAAEGITQGSDAYNTAKDNLQRQQATTSAAVASGAVGQGIGLQNQEFGQGVTATGVQNTAQAQQLAQDQSLYMQPLSVYNAFQTGAQPQMPGFQATPAVSAAGTNTSGNVWNAYQGNVNASNSNNASANATLGTLGSLGMTAAMFY